jgi:hypothetical protein
VGYQSNFIDPGGPRTTLTESWNGAGWSVAPSPNPGNSVNILNGVSCTTSTNCVAVGYYFNASSPTIGQTLIEKWNGTSWSVTPSPDQGSRGNFLFGVFCTSSTNCVAVGNYINGSGDVQTLIETWNGTGWSITPSPDPGSSSSGVEGVYCTSSTNCLAVGYYFSGPSTQQGLVETWNGTIWSVSPSPNPASDGNLASVSCTSATNCVAVGDYINGSADQTLIESWNGSIWSVATSPNQGSDALSSVSCISSTNCVAVGNYSTASANQTLIESWNGISWFITPSPSPGANAYLNGVTCISSTGCFAVGQTFDKSNASRVLVESWNGTSWSVVLPAAPTITITTTSLPPGMVGVPYSVQLEATGGAPPYTWNKYLPKGMGTLPRGVTLSPSGLLSGTPKRAGTFTIAVKCLDSSHSHKTQATQTLTLTINP